MEKAKRKLFKNYILLFLIVILMAILVIPVEWIANHVPDGIGGLLIFMGYMLFVFVIFYFLITKVGDNLLDAEQEIKQQKLKSSTNIFHNLKKNSYLLKNKLLENISKELDINKMLISENKIAAKGREDISICINIDPINNFNVQIDNGEISIVYHTEHRHFYAFDYESGEEFLRDVCDFILEMLNCELRYDYTYDGENIVRCTIWKKSDMSNAWEKVESVGTLRLSSLYPFYKRKIVSKTIVFKQ